METIMIMGNDRTKSDYSKINKKWKWLNEGFDLKTMDLKTEYCFVTDDDGQRDLFFLVCLEKGIKKAYSFEGTKLITIKKWKKEMGLI